MTSGLIQYFRCSLDKSFNCRDLIKLQLFTTFYVYLHQVISINYLWSQIWQKIHEQKYVILCHWFLPICYLQLTQAVPMLFAWIYLTVCCIPRSATNTTRNYHNNLAIIIVILIILTGDHHMTYLTSTICTGWWRKLCCNKNIEKSNSWSTSWSLDVFNEGYQYRESWLNEKSLDNFWETHLYFFSKIKPVSRQLFVH